MHSSFEANTEFLFTHLLLGKSTNLYPKKTPLPFLSSKTNAVIVVCMKHILSSDSNIAGKGIHTMSPTLNFGLVDLVDSVAFLILFLSWLN